jgi:hypothetical protein
MKMKRDAQKAQTSETYESLCLKQKNIQAEISTLQANLINLQSALEKRVNEDVDELDQFMDSLKGKSVETEKAEKQKHLDSLKMVCFHMIK